MGQKYQKETEFTNWGGDFYFLFRDCSGEPELRRYCVDGMGGRLEAKRIGWDFWEKKKPR